MLGIFLSEKQKASMTGKERESRRQVDSEVSPRGIELHVT